MSGLLVSLDGFERADGVVSAISGLLSIVGLLLSITDVLGCLCERRCSWCLVSNISLNSRSLRCCRCLRYSSLRCCNLTWLTVAESGCFGSSGTSILVLGTISAEAPLMITKAV
jgi:hypothetical protein